MKRPHVRLFFSVVMSVMVGWGLSADVLARGTERGESDSVLISGGGGIFYPFQGKSGFNGIIQASGQISSKERMALELEFRKYETELFNAKNIDTKSFIIRGMGQYFFFPDTISPYVGLGINLAVNVFDEDEIERKRPSVKVLQGWGFGYGILGLLGIEVPIGGGVALFGEGRVSGDFQVSRYKKRSGGNRIRVESLSGLTGMGGIRMQF